MSTCDLKIRIPIAIKILLQAQAAENDRTMNGEVMALIKAALKGKGRKNA